MLRALALTCLILVAAPASAAEAPTGAATAQAQENKAPPQAPKRDCERKQEGVSA